MLTVSAMDARDPQEGVGAEVGAPSVVASAPAASWRPYRVAYCVPQWTWATHGAMLRCLLAGAVGDGPDVGRASERLAAVLGVPGVVPCASGTLAIELGLRGAGIGEGAEVVVPAFCCPFVIPPILAVGATPVLADVGAELNLTPETVRWVLTSRTRAVLVPHLFGNPAEIEAILDLCRPRAIAVLDDAAQALGATVGGRPVGTFGDAGVVSFGNGKVCFGTGGGFLVSQDRALLDRARRVVLDPGGPAAGMLRAAAVLVFRRWRRWSHPVHRAVMRIRGGRRDEVGSGYRRERMRNLDAAIARTLLDGLPENLRARRERALLYGDLLAGHPRVAPVPHRPGSACTKQVVAIEPGGAGDDPARRVLDALRREGYEASPSYRPLHLDPAYRAFARGPLPTADGTWRRLVELPCEPSVPLREVRRICAIVRGASG